MHCRWAYRVGSSRRVAAGCLAVIFAASAGAAEVSEGEDLFRTGKYAECARLAAEEIEQGTWEEEWHLLKADAELAEGKYAQALETIEEALEFYPLNLRLRLLARTAYRFNGQQEQADAALDEIERMIVGCAARFVSPGDRVALGRFLLERGADPRQVLELVYDPLRKESPDFVEVYFATAELALDKYDNALAAETLRAAPKVGWPKIRSTTICWPAPMRPTNRSRAEAALAAALAHQSAARRQPAAAGRPADRRRGVRSGRGRLEDGTCRQRESPAGLGVQGGARSPGERRAAEQAAREQALATLDDQSRSRPPDRPQAFGEVSLCRRGRHISGERWRWTPTIGRPSFSFRKTCCGWARRKRAGGWPTKWRSRTPTMSWRSTWSRWRRSWPSFARSAATACSCAWMRARPSCTATACWSCCSGRAQTLCEKYDVTARAADRDRNLSAAEGFCGADVRHAGRGRVSWACASAA